MPSRSPDFDASQWFSFRRTRGIRSWPSRGPWGPNKSRKREILHSRKNTKTQNWRRNESPGHGFECRPLNWPSVFAENPFPATPGPGEVQKTTKIAPMFQSFENLKNSNFEVPGKSLKTNFFMVMRLLSTPLGPGGTFWAHSWPLGGPKKF